MFDLILFIMCVLQDIESCGWYGDVAFFIFSCYWRLCCQVVFAEVRLTPPFFNLNFGCACDTVGLIDSTRCFCDTTKNDIYIDEHER